MGKNRLYMMVTTDEYELPLAVAETARELADMVGVKVNSIYTSMSHHKAGELAKTPYVKVDLRTEGEKKNDQRKTDDGKGRTRKA